MRFGFSVPLGQLSELAHSDLHSRRRRTATHHRTSKPIVHEPSKVLLEMKRTLDVLGAGLGLLILAPLLIGVAIAIKTTSPGPIFFRQKRYGYHNRRFWIYKFRTMYTHLGDQKGTCQTTTDDPRVTSIGRILRKS